jgi:2-dehydro-3-deoxyphosphogluconate aldolase/(4S)-4-hydroxy-2-oxoglutarate aldolase
VSHTISLLDQVIGTGVVPVIRTATQDSARRSVAWLQEAGFKTFEITMTTTGAAELIAELAKLPDLLIGAGTVFTDQEADRVIGAGAKFVVSPCVTVEVGAVCRRQGVPCLMGTLTPTEVFQALRAGADAVKIFPASSVGPGHLKALRSVFPAVSFMPTGGIDATNLAGWFQAGAACVGVGGRLVDENLIARGDRLAVIAAGRQLLDSYRAATS